MAPNAQKAAASSSTPDQDGTIDTMHHNPNRRAAYTVFLISFAGRAVIARNRTPFVCQIPIHPYFATPALGASPPIDEGRPQSSILSGCSSAHDCGAVAY